MKKPGLQTVGIAVAAGMAVYLLFQLFLAWLIVRGILPESKGEAAQVLSGGLSAFLAGLWVAGKLPWGILPSTMTVPCGMGLLSCLSGLLLYDSIRMDNGTVLRLAVMLAGGALAAVVPAVGSGRRKHKKRIAPAKRRK